MGVSRACVRTRVACLGMPGEKSSLIPESERPNYLKPEFLRKVVPLDPLVWLPQLKSQHIRLQQVLDDSVTPKAVQKRIRAAAPKAAQVVTFNSTKQFSRAESGDKISQWAKDQLRQASPPRSAMQESNSQAQTRAAESDHAD